MYGREDAVSLCVISDYRRLVKDPTETVERKTSLCLRSLQLQRRFESDFVPRVQDCHQQREFIAWGDNQAIVARAHSLIYCVVFHLYKQSLKRQSCRHSNGTHRDSFTATISQPCAHFHMQPYVSFAQYDSRSN
jgi:hypothetical protein